MGFFLNGVGKKKANGPTTEKCAQVGKEKKSAGKKHPLVVRGYSDEEGDPWTERRVSEYRNEHRSGVEQKFQRDFAEMNATDVDHDHSIQAREDIPFKPLIVLNAILNAEEVGALKDDGWNTNMVSREFLDKNRDKLHIFNTPFTVRHSEKKTVEESIEAIIGGTIRIEAHEYTTNWAVECC